MNTDRELLELAAKAAGIDAEWLDQASIEQDAATVGLWLKGARGSDNSQYWNPLTDDGDALRLAVKLQLLVNSDEYRAECIAVGFPWIDEPRGNDEFAATRRVITRAAAAIGAHQ